MSISKENVVFPVDISTGEIVSDTHVVYSRDALERRRQAFKNKRETLDSEKLKKAQFTFAIMENIKEVSATLTTAQCGYLLLLQCYIDYETGVLINVDKTPMATANMIDVLQLTGKRQTFYDFFNTCLDNDIIRHVDGGSYAINQRYHFKGTTTSKRVIRSYSAKVRQVYREVRASDLGLIYRMLPYVHFEHNGLCANPFSSGEDAEWFSTTKLADEINVDRSYLHRRLSKMTFGDQYVIARITTGGKTFFMFNPTVFRRKVQEPNETEKALFHVKPKRTM